MFRPNLENPANKEMTAELNAKEIERTEKLKDVSHSFFILNVFS
jgi:hypothetical protein